jgi:hypothetical protein
MRHIFFRLVPLTALAVGIFVGAACDDDTVCAPNTSALSGASCTANSGECFATDYRFDCVRNAADTGYDCQCYVDGLAGATCTMVDICDNGGVFFESGGSSVSERIYTRMESCCGFDVPF